MGDSMDADLLPELSGETWVATALLDVLTVDLPTAGANDELVSDTSEDKILQTVRAWVESGIAPPWLECTGLAPKLRCWRLQVGNIIIDSVGRLWRGRSPSAVCSQLVVPVKKRQDFIKQFHDSLFAGHLGITRLLLAVYVHWKSGLLISSDWLRPVTRVEGGPVRPGGRTEPNTRSGRE